MKVDWKKILVEVLKVLITILSAGAGAYTALHV